MSAMRVLDSLCHNSLRSRCDVNGLVLNDNALLPAGPKLDERERA